MPKKKLPMGYGKKSPPSKPSVTTTGTTLRNPLGSPKGNFGS